MLARNIFVFVVVVLSVCSNALDASKPTTKAAAAANTTTTTTTKKAATNGSGKMIVGGDKSSWSPTNISASNSSADLSQSKLKISQCDKSMKHIATIHNVEIKDCKTPTCTFKRGEKYFIRVDFTPQQSITNLQLNITGIIAKKGVPFAVDDKNLCVDAVKEMKGETRCRVKKAQKHTFEYSMEVLKTYPSIALHVSFQVKYADKSVFCFMFPVKLI
jgi:hypothetical protein